MATADLITELTRQSRPPSKNIVHSTSSSQTIGGKQLVGSSSAFQNVLAQVRQVASLDVGVLLTGERGTGKSLIAEVIHSISPRAAVPFQEINCAAVPEDIAERLLFGSVKGAFTDAKDDKGLFEAADGGTLFLDEIGDTSQALQAKLLRVIETKTVTRLGSHTPKTCNVRLIFATNKSLSALREDFVDRIDEAQIYIPPLRQRREDLPALIEHSFAASQKRLARSTPFILDKVALKVLCEYNWPGNIRQLGNVIFKIALTCKNSETVLPADVGVVLRRRQTDHPPTDDGLQVEDSLINSPEVLLCAPAYNPGEPLDLYFARVLVVMYDALVGTGMSHSQIARTLGIERSTLYSRLKVARELLGGGHSV